MSTNSGTNWKCLWRWITSQNLSGEELQTVLNKKVTEDLFLGLKSYKPLKPESFPLLQSKYPDQAKLLNIVQILQNYIDIDVFQIWDLIKHFLYNISYGTLPNALENLTYVDTRPSFLLPNIWNFYYSERLFLLRLLQYIVDNKNNVNHKYQEELRDLYNSSKRNLISTLVEQFEDVVVAAPPSRKIQSDFGSETVRQEWAEYNLREQLALLQVIILVVDEESINAEHFQKLFKIFRRHNFGKNQGFHELLEERHKDRCMQIMYLEICLFVVICSRKQVENPSSWIEATEKLVDQELTNLQLGNEHSPMLLSWMILSLESKEHAKLFESKFQHYGSTAIRMCVFEFLNQMVNSSLLSDQSKCSKIIRHSIFKLLNAVCDRFDGDGTISRQPGVFPLCEELLSCPETADEFWRLLHKDESFGVVSLWNTALEYFPYNFSMLSSLAAGLAQAGKESARNLIGELKNLPVYTEMYNPVAVPLVSLCVGDDAVLARAYRASAAYAAAAGSRAAVCERREGTMIHFRTPYTYWAIFNDEVEKALDRKHHHRMNESLQRVYEGTKVLRGVVSALAEERSLPAGVARGCEGAFEVLVRLARADAARPLLAQCLRLCAALVPACAGEIHLRLINTGVLPRLLSPALSAAEYASGAALDAGAVGALLVAGDRPGAGGTSADDFLEAYIDMLSAFHQWSGSARAWREVVAPGLVVVAREVVGGGAWRRAGGAGAGAARLLGRAAALLAAVLRPPPAAGAAPPPPPALADAARLLRRIALYSLLYTDSARELLDIISLGNDRLDRIMLDETNWVSGPSMEYVSGLQQCVALLLLALRTRAGEGERDGEGADLTPLDHLIFAQNKQKDPLKVVPRVTSYINHVYSKSLPVLSCRLLQRFADDFQMSLFSSLDMSAYQVRVMFLDRLRDEHESVELKVAILELVTTCVSKQPGLTEAFFMMNQEKAMDVDSAAPEKTVVEKKSTSNDSFEGILGYMADYLGTIKSDTKLLHSPILGCIMGLFHALWKNNMQILVKKLRDSPKFWEYMTSPLFNEIQPGLRTYAQIFNVLGIEVFSARGALDAGLARALERLCDAHAPHLDRWIDFVFAFRGRADAEPVDRVPVWLGLLTSWKDFTTILCRRPPITLNIAHKSKMVAPCMAALLAELEEADDGRPIAILAELYAIMLANWRDDCFENRKLNAQQIERVLTSACGAYERLHPRAARALLAAATGAVACLDYEIRASGAAAARVVRAVTAINGLELDRLLDAAKDAPDSAAPALAPAPEVPAAVLALALLEQCLELYEDAFEELAEWFQASRFVSKLVWWLQGSLGRGGDARTALAALRCLTACARGPFAGDLLAADVDQHLWLPLLRARADAAVYVAGLQLVAALLAGRGQLAAGAAVAFVGVHLEPLVEALRLPRVDAPALLAAAAALHLVMQLLRYEPRWRLQNINSMIAIMRSTSACLQQSVTLALRARRAHEPAPAPAPDDAPHAPDLLHRSVELVQLSTRCLLWFSPPLLALLAGGAGGDLERWPPLVELAFGAPKLAEPQPHLTFGTLLAAVCLLTRMLNHAYHTEEGSGARSPRGRRRACSCGSPGGPGGAGGAGADQRRANRSSSVTSASSGASAPPPDTRLVATALEHAATLLATQALLAVRDPGVPSRHKQLVRRELASELTVYHDFVRKRILCAAHARPHLARTKLGAWPLPADAAELERVAAARRERAPAPAPAPADGDEPPPPPPPKRAAPDSMREYILRKQYLDACARTPPRARPPSPVSTSTPAAAPPPAPGPAPERRKERASKRVSWAETTRDSDDSLDATDALDASLQDVEPAYSNLTDVQINNDEDYFHFMSVVFLYICQTDL